MQTFVTCAVVQTDLRHAFEVGVALRLEAPEGTAVREDPHVPEVFYLEATTTATDVQRALAATAQSVSTLLAGLDLPAEVDEVVVVTLDGAVRWVPGVDAALPAADTH
ncbi:hypothetical protein [Klenkia brasiliensis]|uniref:Uncharacterized protein n=1 Tax=Klenkia brasiliensis TaxID=333142 RepID=A0A1G7Y299_9ACTN|nr:hypothetical protein [Klenkia brasiliensis]SDG90060.1 hypothetical protein SAMN05660324_3880 [Klenkia brasiliensis]